MIQDTFHESIFNRIRVRAEKSWPTTKYFPRPDISILYRRRFSRAVSLSSPMAQSLFTCNSSKLQLRHLQSSNLAGATFHLRRPTAVPCRPRHRRSVFQLAAPESTAIEPDPAPTNTDEIKSTDAAAGDSLPQTNTAPILQISAQNNIPSWKKIVLGAVVILALPLCSKALYLRDLVKNMDSVVEMMQIVAAEAKKSAAELVKALPNGRVKEAAVKLERIASLVDKNAASADSFIDKIDDAVIELDEKLHPGIPDPREVKTKAVTEASLIIPKVKIGDMAAAIAAARGSTPDPKSKAG